MRLFLGTFLDKNLHENIPFKEVQGLFAGNLKTIKDENIHMTWIFIGNVESEKVEEIKKTIEKYLDVFNGLTFQANKLELWPPKKHPRLIVLSGRLNKEINLLEISNELKTISKPDIKDNFIPHITVARFKKDITINKKIPVPKTESFSWQIREISLIQSILTSEGPNYEKLKSWSLSY